ncbi:MAG: undecaprenyl/decaprenyl-phosphate alpha-N-acetylglucosaminyl 1-phosphate transferase [Alkalinema sp. FL-bin-369]|nr:undecaprenyl/decaprenyl-phosphate alpha-N-acetylglucosaminyl 1-phosphate transferase [Leptolyngbyaceae cyanobacterium LF-bin-369]
MLSPWYLLLTFALSASIVLFSTPWVKKLALRLGYVDQPNARKVHQHPMVRLGGVAIFSGFLLALLVTWRLGGFGGLPQGKEFEMWGVVLGGIAFFGIGLLDDLFNLSPFTRLIAQVIVAIGAWSMGVQINFLSVPGISLGGMVQLPDVVSLVLTVIWLVGITNAINWIDGLDGLAAGVSGIAALVMMITCLVTHQPAAALVAAALAGCSLGFLRYNFNPAQIFMGDGGSYFVGFTLAGVGVIGLVKGVTTVAVLLPLILAVPIVDMSAVILDRLRNGKSPFIADKRHLHHRLLQAGLSHRRTVLFIYALTLWVGCLAMAFSGMPSGFGYAALSTVILSFASWRVWQIAKQA